MLTVPSRETPKTTPYTLLKNQDKLYQEAPGVKPLHKTYKQYLEYKLND